MKTITLTVNQQKYTLEISEDIRLIDLLRDNIGLTGTKEGCSEGECGACSVIMNGDIVASCLVLAFQADNSEIITIEGMANLDGSLHPIQKAYLEEGAVQCGFCLPGMVLATKALLDANPKPTRAEIREGLSGNLCRCTGYSKMVDAVEKVVKNSLPRGTEYEA
ncbi:MAG: (2Fe-2S)-binding protein [Methylocystaceae bacterium]